MRRTLWVLLLSLLLIPVVPGLADAKGGHGRGHKGKHGHVYKGGHGYKHYRAGYRGGYRYGYRGGYRYGYRAHRAPFWYGVWAYPAYYGYAGPYPYSPYSRYETRVIVEETPVYVERPQTAAPRPAPPEQDYWHYCESRGGYYPDVPSCPEAWVKVPPRY